MAPLLLFAVIVFKLFVHQFGLKGEGLKKVDSAFKALIFVPQCIIFLLEGPAFGSEGVDHLLEFFDFVEEEDSDVVGGYN